MGNINISDLGSAGADLFLDSESYLNDLTEGEMTNTLGGDPTFSIGHSFRPSRWCSCRCCCWLRETTGVQDGPVVAELEVAQ